MNKSMLAAGLTVLVGVLISAVAWVQVAGSESWNTGARELAWTGETSDVVRCHGDIRLTSVVSGESMWTVCGGEPGSLARLDFADGRAHRLWPLEPGLPHSWSLAMPPDPDSPGTFAYVYRIRGTDRVAAGIAGPDGWIRKPAPLPGAKGTHVLGAGFSGGGLEVVIAKASPTFPYGAGADITVVNLDRKGVSIRERTIRLHALCPPGEGCIPAFAYRRGTETAWRVVSEGPEGKVYDAVETGDVQLSSIELPLMRGVFLDRSVAGVLVNNSAGLEGRLTPAGTVESLPPVPESLKNPSRWAGHYEVDNGQLRYRPRYYDGDRGFLTQLGERQIMVRRSVEAGDEATLVQEGSGSDISVARTFSFSCGELFEGTLVPRQGGFWLATPSGCFVSLDNQLMRADPLGVVEHLQRRGSVGMSWNETEHVVFLGWLLFGLPLCLILAALVARLGSGKLSYPTATLYAGGLFVVAAIYPLVDVLPLMK